MSSIRSNLARRAALAGMVMAPLLFLGLSGKRPAATHSQNLLPAATGQPPAQTEAMSLQESFVRIADRVKPAVVNISTIHVEKFNAPQYEFYFGSPFEDFFDDFFGNQKQKGDARPKRFQKKFEGTGSGVVIEPGGYILTNEHVVRGAKEIEVTLFDDRKYKGKVVGKDVRTDLAIVKIEPGRKLPSVRLGDSDKIRVGEWAIAIGSPFGLQETVTSGIISAVRQSLSIEDQEYRDLIQTDAAINRGNSGGPLCNINGEVIGINTAIYAPTGVFSGVGFAIPINSAKEILGDLMYRGKVTRGWLGVEVRPVDDAIARQFNVPDKKGALVNNVLGTSPAAGAGIRRGDVIRRFSGSEINDVRQLQILAGQAAPGKNIQIVLVRGGEEVVVNMIAGEMPSDGEALAPARKEENEAMLPEKGALFEWEGMRSANIDRSMYEQYEIRAEEKGCIVLDIVQGTLADEIGFLPGDIICSVNRAPTPTIAKFRDAMGGITAADGLVFDVNRQGRLLYLSYSEEPEK